MITVNALRATLPVQPRSARTVEQARADIRAILAGEDSRLLVVVGPCSIHEPESALAYAERLAALSASVGDQLLLVMRTYFEKPRTNLGWRGFLTDPHLTGAIDVDGGVTAARSLLRTINELGLPCATETLDPLLSGYTDDLVAWTALGARTVESQTHRTMASGLPMPVGFKNGTDGNVQTAVDAMLTAAAPQHYPAVDSDGQLSIRETLGNADGHVILRGGRAGPNYDAGSVQASCTALEASRLPAKIMIDCSHANCAKDAKRQLNVIEDVTAQVRNGEDAIMGLMIESHLHEGNQPLVLGDMRYGVSVTDPCLGWDDTEAALRTLHGHLLAERAQVAA